MEHLFVAVAELQPAAKLVHQQLALGFQKEAIAISAEHAHGKESFTQAAQNGFVQIVKARELGGVYASALDQLVQKADVQQSLHGACFQRAAQQIVPALAIGARHPKHMPRAEQAEQSEGFTHCVGSCVRTSSVGD